MKAPISFALTLTLTCFALGGCAESSDATSGATADGADEELQAGKAAISTFTGADGQSYFHLKGGNGEVIAWSEGYAGSSGLNTGIASFKENASKIANYEVRDAADGGTYFVIKAQNGEIIARSETYASKSNTTRARDRSARLVTNIKISEAPRVSRFETFRSLNDSQYYFHLRASNGEIVLASEAYTDKAGAENGIASTKENGKDISRYTVMNTVSGEFYFVLQAGNNQIIGVSEAYKTRASAEGTIRRMVELLGANAAKLQPTVTAE